MVGVVRMVKLPRKAASLAGPLPAIPTTSPGKNPCAVLLVAVVTATGVGVPPVQAVGRVILATLTLIPVEATCALPLAVAVGVVGMLKQNFRPFTPPLGQVAPKPVTVQVPL